MTIIHRPIWSLTPQEVYTSLKTSGQGLSEMEAVTRLKEQGFNELPEPPHRPLLLRFIDQLIHFMALLLWVAGILAFISQTPQLGWAIWAVIWINAIFSFVQEYQAERALTALKKVLPSQVKVYRDETLQVINARELVTGDVIQLEEGDRISADARLVSAQSLYLDVSILTGESLPIARYTEPILTENLRPSDVPNLVLTGSTVAAGRGIAVVYATASRTEFGHVAHLTTQVKRETSTLEVQITRIVRLITALALSMGTLVFLLTHWLVGMETKESFIFAIGIIVAFVPEGLLPTVTLALAIGVKRMAKANALVRRLSAVETLSATTVICTDKTGTLTKNEMTVRALWASGQEIAVTGVGYDPTGEVKIPPHLTANWQVNLLLAGAALCSNARLIHPAGPSYWQEIGDPTEAALLVVALKGGLNLEELHQQAPRQREIPFDSRRRLMTVVLDWQLVQIWPNDFPYLSFTKGSPLEVIGRCPHLLKDGQLLPMNEDQKAEIRTANDHLASQGYRVLGVATRKGGEELLTEDPQELEQNLIFLGLVAMFDPPRPEVTEALARCHQAGIKVTMVTGDYGVTAEAIALRIGLITGKARIVTGEGLGHLSDAQLRQILHLRNGLLFARMMPEQKLRIVQAYKDLGHVVAVTGDGVNDAPALRAANIGIAMGLSGTDVAREAADIVLLDDNFATIVSAVEQGRAVYQNIRKFMTYILSSNMAEIVPFFAMVAFKIPPALVILQILAIDLGTDMIPALALGAELPEAGTMDQPPRSPKKSLLDGALLARAYGFLGVIEAIIGMTAFFVVWWSHGYGFRELQALSPAILSHSADAATMALYAQATTATLAAIVACQDGNVFACRSERVSIFRLGFFSNRLIWLGIAIEWLLILSIIYITPLQKIFSTAPLLPWQWLMLLTCPLLLLGAEELRKVFVYRLKQS
ncbi:cation-transporting P-type ATPase [Crocosphaera sp. UHCC 0190]|uniref:cation-translocating P-type ATPase n=1 Tax=Crocosphaera sp. UHCC 0190 TaxID=3110246 RepID=UPI002B210F6F|nr:cation-transporting P-type ATPase [Crocosphaera sp. UHCC 0190]MEA5508806.1 cation-transporting P-type ATPase [Crocosphaera sp. UHCC 0190]